MVTPQVEKALAEAPVNLPAVVLLNFRDKRRQDDEPHRDVSSEPAAPTAGTPDTSVPANNAPPPTPSAVPESAPSALPPAPEVPSSSPVEPQETREETLRKGDDNTVVKKYSEAAAPNEGVPDAAPAPATPPATPAEDDSQNVEVEPKPIIDASKLKLTNDVEVGKAPALEAGGEEAEEVSPPTEKGQVVTLEQVWAMVDRVTRADEAEGRGGGRLVSLFDCSMKNCFGLRVSNGRFPPLRHVSTC